MKKLLIIEIIVGVLIIAAGVYILASGTNFYPFGIRATPTPTKLIYISSPLRISLKYPSNWNIDAAYNGIPGIERFQGSDGFFNVDALNADSIDVAARDIANHVLQPLGKKPIITKTTIQGQPARIITPSSDQTLDSFTKKQFGTVVVTYPVHTKLGDTTYQYFVFNADIDHLKSIADSLQFTEVSPLSTSQK